MLKFKKITAVMLAMMLAFSMLLFAPSSFADQTPAAPDAQSGAAGTPQGQATDATAINPQPANPQDSDAQNGNAPDNDQNNAAAGLDSPTNPDNPEESAAANATSDPDFDAKDLTASNPLNKERLDDALSTQDIKATPLSPGRYFIRTARSNTRVLDVAGGSTKNSANVQIYSYNGSSAQLFDVSVDASSGLYTITNVKSGKVLDVADGSLKSGANVQQYSPNNSLGQKWILSTDHKTNGQDVYTITSALSSANVLDLSAGKNADGTNIRVYQPNNSASQRFFFVSPSPSVASTKTIDDGIYTLSSNLSGSVVIDVPKSTDSSATQLQIYNANNTAAQAFEVKWIAADNSYCIRSMASALVLDVAKSSLMATTAANQHNSNNSLAQRWSVQANTDGTYTLISMVNALALDVCGAQKASGTKLQLYYPNDTAAQKWTFNKATQVPAIPQYVSITPRNDTSKRVDIVKSSRASGANAQSYKSNSTLAQKFETVSVGTDTYAFRSLNSGLFLTAASGNVIQGGTTGIAPTADQQWKLTWVAGGYNVTNVSDPSQLLTHTGTDIVTGVASGGANQAFRFPSVDIISKGFYIIKTANGLSLDMVDSKTANGTNVQLFKSKNTNAQKWTVELRAGGHYSIISPLASKSLDIANGSIANGANIQIYTHNNKNGQRWHPVPTGDGYFYLRSGIGTYVAADGGGANSGSNVFSTTGSTSNALKVTFVPTTYTPPAPYQGSYIEVNISKQKLMLVKNGYPILETDIITGAPGLNTPTGIYHVLYKQSPAYLMGNAYVVYWMPFTHQGHGFHDASWQNGIFGGSRYVSGYGSHGCVNMPLAAAQKLYQNIDAGYEVRIHL